jgi:sialidase-1
MKENEPKLQGLSLSQHISVIARSRDGGKSFFWQPMGFFGFPFHALPLPDGRVWLTYGYRKKPYGIRGKFLNPECTNFSTAPEIILREDGGTSDIGYPWSVLLADGSILTVYWINENDGLRFIAGTFLR